MDPQTQLYISLAGFSIFALAVTIYALAGKDMIFALKRRFQPRGSDIFVLNNNSYVDRYYKCPDEDGNFKIKGKTYITNPEKIGRLSDAMKLKVEESETKRKAKLHKQIQNLQSKVQKAKEKVEKIKEKGNPNVSVISKLNEYISDMEEKIEFLKNRLNTKEYSYFMQRRSVYFYIENDPVPKDMFQYLSEFDVIQLDNLVARAQTKDRQAAKDMEKILKTIRLYLLIAIGIAAIAAWFAIKGRVGVEDIATAQGVTLTI